MIPLRVYIFLIVNAIVTAILLTSLITLLVDEHPSQLEHWKSLSQKLKQLQ